MHHRVDLTDVGLWRRFGRRGRDAASQSDDALDVLDTATSDRINERRDRACRAALPVLAAATGIMLLLSLLLSDVSLESASGVISTLVAGAIGVGLIVGAWNLSRQTERGGSCHQAAFAVIAVTAVSLAVTSAASGNLHDTAYFELLIVVTGAVLLRTSWFVGALASLWAIWLGVSALLSGTESSGRWTLAMLGATIVAAAIHMMRIEGVRAVSNALGTAEAEAVEDVLTGLFNRRGLRLVGGEMMSIAHRSREALGVTFLDVDGLKNVNDVRGHEAGDDVLVGVADALRSVFRDADVLARWGGDEFVVMALGAGPAAEDVERRLSAQLHALDPELFGPQCCAVSAGRVVHMPWQDEDFDGIVDRADQEMYRRRRLRRSRDGGVDTR